jgi:hypothetical protein
VSSTDDVAARIVEVVITDLSDRSGFDWWWDDTDAGIQDEIRQTLESKVRGVLDARRDGAA